MKRSIGTIYLTFSTFIFITTGYISNIILGRHFGPELYGIYGVLTSLMTALTIILVSGVPQAVSKFTAEKKQSAEDILVTGLMIQTLFIIIVGFIFFLFAPLIANIFNNYKFEGYVRLMALIFPFYGIFALFGGYYNGLHNFKRQAIMNSVYAISKLILVVSLSIKFGLFGTISGFIISPLIALLFGFKVPSSTSRFRSKQLIWYSLPLIGFAILATLQLSIDLFTLKSLSLDPKIAGYYTAAQNIAIIPYYAMSAIGVVLFPSMSRFLGIGQLDEAREVVTSSLRYLLLILLPLATLIEVTAPDLVQLLFGNKYLPTVASLRILIIGYVLLTLFAMFSNVLNGSGHAKTSMIIAALGVVSGFVGCIIFIPHYGANGAATGTLIGSSVSAVLSVVATYRIIEFSFSIKSMFRILAGSLVVFTSGLLIPTPLYLLPLLYVLLGILYLATIHILDEITLEDRSHIKNLLPVWFPFTRWL
jgi:stage V sporulation protein B